MTRPTKPLLISYTIFGVALAAFIVAAVVGATEGTRQFKAMSGAGASSKFETTVEPTSQPGGQEAVQNDPEQAPAPVTVPPAGGDTDVPTKEQGAHIPFTQEPVTPGDPASYVDTVGQCPFYEMAGPKGCIPPPDIQCNADWSMCDPVVDQKGEVTP